MLQKAIKENPCNQPAYLALGDVFQKQQKTKMAIEVYRELMQQGRVVHGLKEKLKFLEEQYEAELEQLFKEKLEKQNKQQQLDTKEVQTQDIKLEI